VVGLFQTAELSTTITDDPDPVDSGAVLTYTITVTNAGPDPAADANGERHPSRRDDVRVIV
jgi:hypothetical protein